MSLIKRMRIKIFFLLISISLILTPQFIPINNIECVTQLNTNCTKDLEVLLKDNLGQRQFEVKRKLKGLLESRAIVKNVHFKYYFPNTMKILLEISEPKFYLKSETGKWVALIDENGFVVDLKEGEFEKVVVTDYKIENIGSQIKSNVLFGLKVHDLVKKDNPVEIAKIKEDQLNLKLEDGPNVIFPLEGDVDYLVGSLNIILSRLKTDSQITRINSSIKQVDLRYKNPVLK